MSTPENLTEVTDLDFDLALQNARERGDAHLHRPLVGVFRTNPRFIYRLLAEASERAQALTTDESERKIIEDAILEGAALVIAAQQQHLTSSQPPIASLAPLEQQLPETEISPAA